MYSVSRSRLLATNVVGAWMIVLFATALSDPLANQIEQNSGPGSACAIKSEYQLEQQFLDDNAGLQNPYLRKLIAGQEAAYAGSFPNIFNSCVEELVMEHDSERFPQYVIKSTCKDDDNCIATTNVLIVRKLNRAFCDGVWQNYDIQPPLFVPVCVYSS